MASSVVAELMFDASTPKDTSTSNTTSDSQVQSQWVEISFISSFTTKWCLFQHFNDTFGTVLDVKINEEARKARVLFAEIESAKACCGWYRSEEAIQSASYCLLDGERVSIDFCDESNISKRNVRKCLQTLTKNLHGIADESWLDQIKFSAENLENMTPLQLCKSHAKILKILTASVAETVLITDAFTVIGIDSFAFSDHFNCVSALQSNELFYANLVSNIKLFGRFSTPIKCIKANFCDCYRNLPQNVVYIDTFHMNTTPKLKWNDCGSDISYIHNNSTQSLSSLCNDIYQQNQMKMSQSNTNTNSTTDSNATAHKQLMLIAVKVPKHFMVAEFQQKVQKCHIVVLDFKQHQFMILDYIHQLNELRALEYKCNKKRQQLAYHKLFIFQSTDSNYVHVHEPALKKRKMDPFPRRRYPSIKDTAYKVTNLLHDLGFKRFGEEHVRTFREKLRTQIYSKQLIREKIDGIDLRSKFQQIENIESFLDQTNIVWLAPNIIAPRFLIYATAKWTILVDECQNMWYHPQFNTFYQTVFFGTNLAAKHSSKPEEQQQHLFTVSIVDGFLIPSNYFAKYCGRDSMTNASRCSPLQFWILDVLSYQNNTAVVLAERFKFFQSICKAYKQSCNLLQNADVIPISIHSLHYEEFKHRHNVLRYIKPYQHDDESQYQECIVYANKEGHRYAVNGFVAIKNKFPCTVHNRGQYLDRCVLWKCDFNAVLSQQFALNQSQNHETSVFQT